MAEPLVRPESCVPCALRALCVCVVRPPPFLPPLPPWLPWLVWLRVRPRLWGRHVGLAGPVPARFARDDTLQSPAGAGLAGRLERARAAPGSSTLWAEEAAAWGARGAPGLSEAAAGAWASVCCQRGAGAPRVRPGPARALGSSAGVRQPGSGPGYLGGGRGGGRGPATVGSRASGKLKAGTRDQWEGRLAGLFSERGLGLRTLAASVEEVSSSGRTCTAPVSLGQGPGPLSPSRPGTGPCGVLMSLRLQLAALTGCVEQVVFLCPLLCCDTLVNIFGSPNTFCLEGF